MDKSYLRIRNFLGILGCLLSVFAITTACFSPNTNCEGWWYSISITYYSSPVLIMLLTSVGLFLICYRGYNIWDTLVNTTAGIMALFVVIFPCTCYWLNPDTKVGLFWLPMKLTNTIHEISAEILFLLFAVNDFWLFSKGDNIKKRIVYHICGTVILIGVVGFLITVEVFKLEWFIIIWETIMLFAFGISWITKGHMLDKFLGD